MFCIGVPPLLLKVQIRKLTVRLKIMIIMMMMVVMEMMTA